MVQFTQYRLTGHLCAASSDFSADKRPENFTGHFPGFSLGNNSNRASTHIYTGRKGGGKGGMN